MRKLGLLLGAVLLFVPVSGRAGVDASCGSLMNVTGKVTDLNDRAIEHIQLDVFATNQSSSAGNISLGTAYSAPDGTYRACINSVKGTVYEVRATDPGLGIARKPDTFETKGQEFDAIGSTQTATQINFKLPYLLTLEATPPFFNAPTTITIKARAMLTPTTPVPMEVRAQMTLVNYVAGTESNVGAEFSISAFGPDPTPGSPFYLWKASLTSASLGMAANQPGFRYELKSWAREIASQKILATVDRVKLAFDSPVVDPPKIGSGAAACGVNGTFRLRASAATVPSTSTTNPRPDVYVGSCDGVSGIAFDSVTLLVDGVPATTGIQVKYVNTANYMDIDYIPPSPGLSVGSHTFQYSVKDNAGNSVTSGTYSLQIVLTGGASVQIINPAPRPTHPGLGIPGPTFGFGFADTYPVISCSIVDADGQTDIVWGSVSVAVYYNGVVVRKFDPNDPNSPGTWDPETGVFTMEFDYQTTNPPAPGLYTVVASASDHGGNSATLSWQFILAFAA